MSELKKTIREIFQEVLGSVNFSDEDNFFDIGGDSFSAIRVVMLAKEKKLDITVNQIFKLATVKDIAKTVSSVKNEVNITTDSFFGKLLPIQQWFFEQDILEPDHFNQAMLFSLKESIDEARLRKALSQLLHQYPHLNASYSKTGYQVNKPESIHQLIECVDIDVENLDELLKYSEDKKLFYTINTTFDLEEGDLLRLVIIYTRKDIYMYMVVHHMVIDIVSWELLINLLFSFYDGIDNTGLHFASYSNWLENLSSYAISSDLQVEKEFWYSQVSGSTEQLYPTLSHEVFPPNMNSYHKKILINNLSLSLDARQIEILSAYLIGIQRHTNQSEIVINLESHGRSEISDADPSLLIGWLTALYPLKFIFENVSYYELQEIVKNKLSKVPSLGIGYGLLKYYCSDAILNSNQAQCIEKAYRFNFLGNAAQRVSSRNSYVELVKFDKENVVSNKNIFACSIDLQCMIEGDQLLLMFSYNERAFSTKDIENIAEVMESQLNESRKNHDFLNQKFNFCDYATQYLKLEDQDPIYFFYPQTGHLKDCHLLLNSLSENHPVIAYDALPITNETSCIDKLSHIYAKNIALRDESDQVSIAGWSFGAILGFSVATYLEKFHQKQCHLIAIDQDAMCIQKQYSNLIEYQLLLMNQKGLYQPILLDKEILSSKNHKRIFEETYMKLVKLPEFHYLCAKDFKELYSVPLQNMLLVSNYFTSDYIHRIDCIMTNKSMRQLGNLYSGVDVRDAGWGCLTNVFNLHSFPSADHFSIMKNATQLSILIDKNILNKEIIEHEAVEQTKGEA